MSKPPRSTLAPLTLDELRRYAVTRSLFPPTTVPRALARMQFVQADPIRAPARAQDLILRLRVKDYRAGELERRYESLGVEEDFFVNYGYITRKMQAMMHPRPELRLPTKGKPAGASEVRKREAMLLEFVAARGAVHPREVQEHFAHGTVQNYWGGSSYATTQMLDALHYRGLLRVVRREKGIRVYHIHRPETDALDDIAVEAELDALVDMRRSPSMAHPHKTSSLWLWNVGDTSKVSAPRDAGRIFMKTYFTLALIALLPFATIGFAQNKPEELKQRILTQAQSASPDDYAFTSTTRFEQTSSGKTEQTIAVENFDPAKSGDARWTLVSINGAPPPAGDAEKFRKGAATRRIPGYYRLADYFGSPATASTESRGRAVFHFTNLPKETLMVMGSDVSQNATIDATAGDANGTPFIGQVRITLKPTRVKLIAKIERFEATSRYRMGPEGRPLLMEQVSDVSGSGLGKKGSVHTVVTYSDYRSLRKKP